MGNVIRVSPEEWQEGSAIDASEQSIHEFKNRIKAGEKEADIIELEKPIISRLTALADQQVSTMKRVKEIEVDIMALQSEIEFADDITDINIDDIEEKIIEARYEESKKIKEAEALSEEVEKLLAQIDLIRAYKKKVEEQVA